MNGRLSFVVPPLFCCCSSFVPRLFLHWWKNGGRTMEERYTNSGQPVDHWPNTRVSLVYFWYVTFRIIFFPAPGGCFPESWRKVTTFFTPNMHNESTFLRESEKGGSK